MTTHTSESITHEIQNIICNIIQNENIPLEKDTIIKNLEGWDSMLHIHLIIAIEKKFSIKLNIKDLEKASSINDFSNLILDTLNQET